MSESSRHCLEPDELISEIFIDLKNSKAKVPLKAKKFWDDIEKRMKHKLIDMAKHRRRKKRGDGDETLGIDVLYERLEKNEL